MMLTIKQASEKSGLPYSVIRDLILKDKIRYIKSGVKFFVNWQSLVEYCGGEAV